MIQSQLRNACYELSCPACSGTIYGYTLTMLEDRQNWERWWSSNLGKRTYLHNGVEVAAPSLENFRSWMGDEFSEDRIFVRGYFNSNGSFLDVGCGAAPEYEGLKSVLPNVSYTGVDITPELVEFNQSREINCFLGSANSLPFEENSFDMLHCRHVVEHMQDINLPLSEFIRVASDKVFLVFFIGPSFFITKKKLDNEGTDGEVFHNSYSRRNIKKFLKQHKKVSKFKFIKLPKPSTYLLHIELLKNLN